MEKLQEIYDAYGYCLNTLHSYEFDGSVGMVKMQNIMNHFRLGVDMLGGKRVLATQDYSKGLNNLPKSDVIKYILEDSCSAVVRPSGTEPWSFKKRGNTIERDFFAEIRRNCIKRRKSPPI